MNPAILAIIVRNCFPIYSGNVFNGIYGAVPDAGETDDPTVDATLYSGSNNYTIGAMVTDGSGNYYISEKFGNAGNALTDATSWFAVTTFCYIDFTNGVDDTRALASNPATAKAAPFKTLSAMNNRTYSPSPTGYTAAPAGTLFLLKRGDSYGSDASGDAGNIQFEKNSAYAGCWGDRSSARPVVIRRNNYQGPGQFNYWSGAIRGSTTNGTWRLRNINFDGQGLASITVPTFGGIGEGDTIIGGTSGVTARVVSAHTVVPGSVSYLDVSMAVPATAFVNGETITGSPSGGSTTVSSFGLSQCLPSPRIGGWKLLNSDVQNFPGDGIEAGSASYANSGDNTLTFNCTVHSCSNGGAAQHGAGYGWSTGDSPQLLNCTFYDNAYANNIFSHHVYNNDSTNGIVAYCEMYSTFNGANLSINFHGICAGNSVHHNYCHSNVNGISFIGGYGTAEVFDTCEVYCNILENLGTLPGVANGNGMGLYLGSVTNSRFFDNVFSGSIGYAMSLQDYASSEDTPSANNSFLQNTVYGQPQGINILGLGSNVMGASAFQNNIFYLTTSSAVAIRKSTTVSDSTITLDHNVFYVPSTASPVVWDGTSYSVAGLLSAKSKGANSVTTDPLFTNAGAGDYTLQSGSPAKGVGATGLGITTDFAGNAFTSPPNMGAYA